ncbi:MAG: alkaline phosphatase family protein [Fidelibacterota bacterium]
MKRTPGLLLVPLAILLVFLTLYPAKPAVPRMVLYLVVDQMRDDFLDRFDPLFEGGFRYLLDNGIRFTHTFHDHAYTATAPGIFAVASGVHPGRGTIIANDYYDREKGDMMYCVADDQARVLSGKSRPVSYRNVPFTALGDWMKSSDPSSKVFAVSSKDRAAVLLGGRRPDGVYWLDSNTGEYVTSDYYVDRYPDWLQAFRAARPIDAYVGLTWTRLLSDERVYLEYSREDPFPPEASGSKNAEFPHRFPETAGEDPIHFWALWESPWLDAFTFDLARVILENEPLGKDAVPDLLAISPSVTDGVGHRYGPFSQEVMDTFLRLDRLIGELITFLDQTVGMENVLVVLTSDHGAAMMPEYAERLGLEAGRLGKRMSQVLEELEGHLRKRWGPGTYIENYSNGTLTYEMETLAEKGLSREAMDRAVTNLLMENPWILKVVSRTDLMSGRELDPIGELWRHQFHPELSGDLFVSFKENYVWRDPVGTGHGTVHDYDRQVPLVFSGPGLKSGVIGDTVRTVDVAPTIAHLLGIPIPENLDGKVLDVHGREHP